MGGPSWPITRRHTACLLGELGYALCCRKPEASYLSDMDYRIAAVSGAITHPTDFLYAAAPEETAQRLQLFLYQESSRGEFLISEDEDDDIILVSDSSETPSAKILLTEDAILMERLDVDPSAVLQNENSLLHEQACLVDEILRVRRIPTWNTYTASLYVSLAFSEACAFEILRRHFGEPLENRLSTLVEDFSPDQARRRLTLRDEVNQIELGVACSSGGSELLVQLDQNKFRTGRMAHLEYAAFLSTFIRSGVSLLNEVLNPVLGDSRLRRVFERE